MSSDQEEFWRGSFGDEYTERCSDKSLVVRNIEFFRRALRTELNVNPHSDVIEFGANRGLNILALELIGFEFSKMKAVEINHSACCKLRNIEGLSVVEASMLDGEYHGHYDIVISKGVLIHIGERDLPLAYDALHTACRPGGVILIAEYFAPTPTPVTYRGHEGKLWRRDFAGEMLDRYDDLKLSDYGFVYSRDPIAPQDNLNWFLLERV